MTTAATCRVCGCTDDNACEGGCSWIAPDLCSRCTAIFRAYDYLNLDIGLFGIPAPAAFMTGFEWGMRLALRHPEWAAAAVAEVPPERSGTPTAQMDELFDTIVQVAPVNASAEPANASAEPLTAGPGPCPSCGWTRGLNAATCAECATFATWEETFTHDH